MTTITIIEKLEEIRKAELALERLKKEYDDMWESTFPKPDYGFTKTPTHISIKDLHKIFSDNLIPEYDFNTTSTCPSCGLVMGGVMGYVCNRAKCPTGLGGAFC